MNKQIGCTVSLNYRQTKIQFIFIHTGVSDGVTETKSVNVKKLAKCFFLQVFDSHRRAPHWKAFYSCWDALPPPVLVTAKLKKV
jgi:hypothetical protein